jgi:hypothetical protein
MPEIIDHIPKGEELHQWAEQQKAAQQLEAALTDAELIPHIVDIAEKTGLDAEVLKNEDLRVHDLKEGSYVLDVTQAGDIDGNGLVGLVQMGDSAVRIYGYKEDGKFVPGAFTLLPGNYEEPPEEERDWARKITVVSLPEGQTTIIGRSTPAGDRLGLKEDTLISRNHFSAEVTPDGKLILNDLESTNGTSVVTAEKSDIHETIATTTVREIGDIAIAEVIEAPDTKERILDGVTFRLDGALINSGREAYAFTTKDSEGKVREFFVYRSGSEGALRVSPGIEKFPNGSMFMKGNALNPHFQYTQDTQLNPQFAATLSEMISASGGELPLIATDIYEHEGAAAERVMADFGSNMETTAFPDAAVATDLVRVNANDFAKYKLSEALGVEDWNQLDGEFKKYISRLNSELEQSNIIPDFSTAERVETDTHPSLGTITREIFNHSVNGLKYEWHVAHDADGRVWIDRIRYKDAELSAYGTDKQIVHSGVLTSKPIDYHEQTNGLPEEYVQAGSHGPYSDVSRFLDTLAPIKQYRLQRNIQHRES